MNAPTTTPGGKPPKKARKKVTTDLGRQLLTRERQRLSREQAVLAEQQLKEAEQRRQQQKRNTKSIKPIDIAVSRSIVKRFAGVLASEGVSVRISCTPSHQTSAWTDFEQIVINYEQQDDDRTLAAVLRALGYHEGGHCRWTLPFLQLAEEVGADGHNSRHLHHAWNCLEDQRMETAVVSDSPRKAAYLTPMVMLHLVPNVSAAAANWPLLIWRRYLPKHIRTAARKLFVTKHNLMGIDGSKLAQDLEVVTTKYVLADNAADLWAAILEYHELLKLVAPMLVATDDRAVGHDHQYRKNGNLDDFLIIPVAGDCEGGDEEGDEKTEATTPDEFQKYFDIVTTLLSGGDILGVIYASSGKGEDEKSDEPGQPGESTDEEGSKESDDDESSDDEGDESGEGEESGEGGDDAGKKYANESTGTHDKGGSKGEHKNTGVREDLDYKPEGEGEELTDEDLQAAIDEATAERNADPTLDGDVQALHEAINTRTSDLLPYIAGVSTDVEAKAAADNLAQDIEQAFRESTVDKAPGWVEGQRRGLVNVLRYETRRPGTVDFFRAYTETDAPGTNISVSVLLDYSASMNWATKELAQVGYACKAACSKLDIPCTVTLWDTSATVLFDATEEAEHLPVIVATGGTHPGVGLADLDRQRYGKETHIVIIMTDGAWGGDAGSPGFVASYKGDQAGRYFIGLGFAEERYSDSAQAIATNLRRYGCDESHALANLMEIPRYLEEALIAFA